jgi:beta-glucosidase
MSIGDNTPVAVHEAFAQIANADIEALLKQLTQDEKVALLTGLSWLMKLIVTRM